MSPRAKILYGLVVVVLLAGNIFLAYNCLLSRRESAESQKAVERSALNAKGLDFTRLFIEKVVQSDKEVDFETRLELENRVRELGDKKILDQWNKFTASASEADAQREVKALLLMLIDKARGK